MTVLGQAAASHWICNPTATPRNHAQPPPHTPAPTVEGIPADAHYGALPQPFSGGLEHCLVGEGACRGGGEGSSGDGGRDDGGGGWEGMGDWSRWDAVLVGSLQWHCGRIRGLSSGVDGGARVVPLGLVLWLDWPLGAPQSHSTHHHGRACASTPKTTNQASHTSHHTAHTRNTAATKQPASTHQPIQHVTNNQQHPLLQPPQHTHPTVTRCRSCPACGCSPA